MSVFYPQGDKKAENKKADCNVTQNKAQNCRKVDISKQNSFYNHNPLYKMTTPLAGLLDLQT